MNTNTVHIKPITFFYITIGTVFIMLGGISCSSLQSDRMLSLSDDSLEAELTSLTLAIVPLDRNPNTENVQKARSLITELEERKIEDTLFRARLAAWSGRLFLIEGSKKNAEKEYKNANNLVSNDPSVTVLFARLEKNPEIKLSILEKGRNLTDNTALIDIEKGRVLCELGRWREAVAAFDTAFPNLPAVYQGTYADDRENAWNLRAVDSQVTAHTAEIAAKQVIVWKEALTMVQTETSLLSFLTGDAVWTSEKIAQSLFDNDLVPKKTDTSSFLDTPLSRSDVAFFLWHLHARWQGKPPLLTRYSTRYKSMRNPVSPIPDISLSDVFFDSVLGCIEWEFMSLPDGKNFNPNDSVKGSAFLQMVQKTESASCATF